jgi:hypothetical protein
VPIGPDQALQTPINWKNNLKHPKSRSACHFDDKKSGISTKSGQIKSAHAILRLKRRYTMNDEKVLCSNVLTIRFDQLEDNRVNWYVEPDDKVWETQSLSLIELAESGAPLSALAIRALWKLCMDGLVFNSLEQANSINFDVSKRLVSGPVVAELDLAPEGVTIN